MYFSQFFVPILLLVSAFGPAAHAQPAVLQRILEEASSLRSAGVVPVLIMDLDETTVDSASRKALAIREAALEICDSSCQILSDLSATQVKRLQNDYSYQELFESLRLRPSERLKRLESRSLQLYLSGYGLELDEEVPGAIRFVQDFRRRGGRVFFVTARHQETQREGTFRNLHALGLLGGTYDEKDVILKPMVQGSLDFKKEAFARIRSLQGLQLKVIGTFENEPENMNALQHAFPEAQGIFIERAFLKHEPLIENRRGGPFRIADYR